MTLITLLAILVSAALILLLGLGDPKRRRAARQGQGHGARLRQLLAVGGFLPGLNFILYGDAAAFLLWLGGTAVAGWVVTLVLASRSDPKGVCCEGAKAGKGHN
ncbi:MULTISPECIES: hypothetical protein [unclassified Sphingobium]|uniref:hypothetical protein n=1 Tax=unclassified Sphingobium TaxID=2611147 RepID=UPI0035A600A0